MIFVLTKTVTHGFMKRPFEQKTEFEAESYARALKKLTIPTKQVCDLRRFGVATFVDHKNSTITLTLKEKK